LKGVDFLIKEERVDSSKWLLEAELWRISDNWIIGHTGRFKAAVTVAGISNTVSLYSKATSIMERVPAGI